MFGDAKGRGPSLYFDQGREIDIEKRRGSRQPRKDMEEGNHERRPFHLASVFPGIHLDVDVVDVPTDTPSISRLDIFFLACSIVMHLVDMGFDYNIAIRYYLGGKITYFVWTMCLILIPSLINVAISRRMQHQDKQVK